jgi:hypothetical protein
MADMAGDIFNGSKVGEGKRVMNRPVGLPPRALSEALGGGGRSGLFINPSSGGRS